MITLFLALPSGASGPDVSHPGWGVPHSHDRLDSTPSPVMPWGEQIMFDGEEGSSRAGGDTYLVVNVLDMVVYRLL